MEGQGWKRLVLEALLASLLCMGSAASSTLLAASAASPGKCRASARPSSTFLSGNVPPAGGASSTFPSGNVPPAGGASSPGDPAGPGEGFVNVLARAYPTPERLAAFLQQEITFQDDRSLFGVADYWQEPDEFLARRQGDCEDYALLAWAVLRRQGREAFVFSLYGEPAYAHTVCVFVEEGRYNILNQDRVMRCKARSWDELAIQLCPGWRWGAVAQRAGSRGQAVWKIFRTRPERPSRVLRDASCARLAAQDARHFGVAGVGSAE